MRFLILIILCCAGLAGCNRQGQLPEDIPTRVSSLDDLATAQFMTANAPPEGFRDPVAFPLIDANLNALSNWRYEAFMSFDGVFARTDRRVNADTRLTVWFNDLGPERRALVQGTGDLFGHAEATRIEGVRLGGDTFLLRDEVCLSDAGDDAALVADLRAGALIGGVTAATSNGLNAIINGEQVWQYAFSPAELNLPQVAFGEGGRISEMRGELWIAPAHNAVIRFYVTMQVENALILLDTAETRLPVSGQLLIRYDLYDIGLNPNITQPFGC